MIKIAWYQGNTFIPESIQTRVEIEELAGVSKQIISPATSTPIISVAQDSMVGSYILTKTDFATTGEQLFHYMMPIIQLKSNFNFIKSRDKEKWTGNELYSTILPNISLKNSKIEIRNGEIISGVMNKTTLGGSSKGIIQAIINQHGTRVCRDFLDNLQRLVVAWMEDVSFSIGFGDAMPLKNIRTDIQDFITLQRKESDELIRKAQIGLYEPYLNNELKMAKLELDILNIGNKTTEGVQAIVTKQLPVDNNFMISVDSGSKGNAENLNQIMGVVGQRNIDGDRITYGLTGRTLPHYTKWDIGLESKGFVFNSYMNGLTPQEFFFTSMNSRSDAINSNIKTAETGYIQRRLIKSMEDLKVEYDGTVRDSAGNIVQVSYGTDGYDSIKLEHVPINLIKKNNLEMENSYKWNNDDISEVLFTEEAYENYMKNKDKNELETKKEWEQLSKDREDLRYKYYANINKDVETILAPINLKRLIYQMINQFQIEKYDQSDMTPIEAIKMVSELTEYVSHFNTNNEFSPILKILIRSNLSSKQCIFEHRLPGSILKHLVEVIKYKMLYAIVNPGEMVGIIAAQSIGEPITQLVLKSYHNSGGLGNQSVITNSGVPRVQEIINMSKEIKTPSMTIYLKPQYSENKEIAFRVKNQIEYTAIKDLVLSSEILYIPDKSKGKYPEEEEQYRVFQEIVELTETQCPSEDSLSNWVLWMEFDREVMLRKNVYMSDIQEEIVKNCNVDTEIHCVVSNMNSDHLTLRIRVNRSLEEGEGYISFFRHIGDCLMEQPLRGIPGINSVDFSKVSKAVYRPDGTMEFVEEYILKTDGSNLIAVLSNDYVDETRTTTNDIIEIHKLFGIEGSRYAIIREMKQTVSDGADTNINERHYSVLADLMTYRGKIMQIQRNGFGKSPYIGPLGRATYEVMDKILVTSGIFAEDDNMEGTSSNIITGQGPKSGTNSFDLFINKNLLPLPNQEQEFYPPEQNVNEKIEVDYSPAFTPIDSPENFQFDEDFMEKMTSSKEVKLEDYLKAIGAQSTSVDDNDFKFGYDISGEENMLPETKIVNIEVNITESDNNVKNRRRRKR
jgi:DNA-directed RNA polymerase II subunit RPB1